MNRKLPVAATVIAIFKLTFDNFDYALRIVWPWFAALLILLFLTGAIMSGGAAAGAGLLGLLLMVVYIAGWSSIAVLWHRRLLRGEELGGVAIRLDRVVGRYLVYFILIALIVFLPAIFGAAVVAGIGAGLDGNWISLAALGLPLLAIVLIASLRLSVALPAVALEHESFGLGDAWNATAGNGLRLLLIMIATTIPFILADMVLGQFGGVMAVVAQILALAINLVSVLIGVTLMSLAYGYLVENKAAGTTLESET